VNYELLNLERLMESVIDRLQKNGMLAVISFHSGEDSRVTKYMRQWVKEGLGKYTSKEGITPDEEELKENIRSHSAKMRLFIK